MVKPTEARSTTSCDSLAGHAQISKQETLISSVAGGGFSKQEKARRFLSGQCVVVWGLIEA